MAGLDGELADRTGDVAELLQEVGVHRSQQNRHDPTTEVSFHCLLRTEDYERCGAEKEAAHVGGNVVDGDDGHGEDVPDHAVLEGEVEEVSGPRNEESGEVSPGQQTVAGQAVRLVADGEDEP